MGLQYSGKTTFVNVIAVSIAHKQIRRNSIKAVIMKVSELQLSRALACISSARRSFTPIVKILIRGLSLFIS